MKHHLSTKNFPHGTINVIYYCDQKYLQFKNFIEYGIESFFNDRRSFFLCTA